MGRWADIRWLCVVFWRIVWECQAIRKVLYGNPVRLLGTYLEFSFDVLIDSVREQEVKGKENFNWFLSPSSPDILDTSLPIKCKPKLITQKVIFTKISFCGFVWRKKEREREKRNLEGGDFCIDCSVGGKVAEFHISCVDKFMWLKAGIILCVNEPKRLVSHLCVVYWRTVRELGL